MRSDPFELVRAANPVPSPTAFPADVRARITTAIVTHTRCEHGGGIVSALRRAARLRIFALAAGVMVVAGGTTAAIAVLSGQPSAPPSGTFTVPTGATQRGVPGAPTHYSITATPDLNGGAVGWCLQDHFYFAQGRYSGGGGCGHIQLADTAIVGVNAGSGSSLIGPLDRRSSVLHYASYSDLVYMTTARVAAVRVSPTLTIRTRADPQLPDGYRIAVAIHESITSVLAGQRPQRRSSSPNPFAVVPLDGAGRPIPSHLAPFPPPREPGAFWQAQPTSGVGPQPTLHRPPAGACEIDTSALRGIELFFGSVVQHIRGVPQLTGRTYLSCAETQFGYRNGVDAAILLDAQHPGSAPAPIPNAAPVPGHPGIVDEPASDIGTGKALTARRVGNAWLVIETGGTVAYRVNVLGHLAACVHLHGALCAPPA